MPTRRRTPVYRGNSDSTRRFEEIERKLAEVRWELGSVFEVVLETRQLIEDMIGDCVPKPARRRSRRSRKRKSGR